MAFAVIFLIVLSVILIVGAYLIWKSDLPENDKMISIMAILALFAVVTIINEAKKSTVDDVNVAELESYFFNPRELEIDHRYELPLLNDYKEFVASTLGEYSLENSKSVAFLLLEGDKEIGKTLAFKEYVRMLQIEKKPALYLDLKYIGSEVYRLANYFKLSNITMLGPVFDKFNKDGHIPVIVLDHFDQAFRDTDSAVTSTLCQYLKELFDSKKVNLVLITSKSDVKLKLRADVEISRRLTVQEFKQRSYETIEKYLVDKYNPAIVKYSEKRFNQKNIQFLLNKTSFYWDVLYAYKLQMNEVANVQDFCRTYIHNLTGMLQGRTEEKEIYEAMIDSMWNSQAKKYINQGVLYSTIRTKSVDEHFVGNLKLSTSDGILKIGHGTIHFANVGIFQAAIQLKK